MHIMDTCGRVRFLVPGATLLMATGLSFGQQLDEEGSFDVHQPHRMLYKEPRPLKYDVARIAIETTEDPMVFWASHGVGPGEFEPMASRGWSTLPLEPGARSIDGVLAAVEFFARMDGVRTASPVFLDSIGNPLVPTSQLLVRFNENVGPIEASAIFATVGAGAVTEQAWSIMPGSYKVTSGSRNGLDAIARANALALREDIRFAEVDFMATAIPGGMPGDLPDDVFFHDCWGLHNTGQTLSMPHDGMGNPQNGTPGIDMMAVEAWKITQGDPSVLVMIMDNGIQQDHPDINQVVGNDFTDQGPGDGGPVNTCDNHGTSVAGCVAALMNNGPNGDLGTVGIAPGVKVVSARYMLGNPPDAHGDCTGSSYVISAVVEALEWAAKNGVRITCNSNVIQPFDSINDSYAATRALGTVHFAASGNYSASTLAYPANLPSVNAVTGIIGDGTRWNDANHGPGNGLSAPAFGILTTDRTGGDGYEPLGDYVVLNGTSYAAPYAAGVAALLLSRHPELTATEVENILFTTATDLGPAGYDTEFGHGLVNAHAALQDAPITARVPEEYATIQAAIGALPSCSVILVGPGTYVGAPGSDYVVDYVGENEPDEHCFDVERSYTIIATDGPSVTFIDGEGVRGGVRIRCAYNYCTGTIPCGSVLEGFTITGGVVDEDGGGVVVDRFSKDGATIRNCTITGNRADIGGGISVYGEPWPGTVSPRILNCTISGNMADLVGGGIAGDLSDATIHGCLITGNTAFDLGGGVFWRDGSPAFGNCTVSSNQTTAGLLSGDGGGAALSGTGTKSFETCIFTENTALGSGGGIDCLSTGIELIDCEFSLNESDDGGGINLSDAQCVMNQCRFYTNRCTGALGRGGAIRAAGGAGSSAVLSELDVAFNQVGRDGGGIHFSGNGLFVLLDSSLEENTCVGDGAGFYCDLGTGANCMIQRCFIQRNIAQSAGGGLYVNSASGPTVSDTQFCANSPDDINGPIGDAGGNTACPTGACCLPTGCLVMTSAECTDAGGSWAGKGTTCAETACTLTVGPGGFGTIQEALDVARDGDTIHIAEGTFQPESTLELDGLAITIRGTLDEHGVPLTIIDGQNAIRLFKCWDNEGPDTVFEDLMITRGSESSGGALYCYNASPVVRNCHFIANTASDEFGSGGAVYLYGSSAEFEGCTFTNNIASSGGGAIRSSSSAPRVVNCVFTENEVTGEYAGGGAFSGYDSNALIDNCLFQENVASGAGAGGGGAVVWGGLTTIQNSTFQANSCNATYGGGAGLWNNLANTNVSNCIFNANQAVNGYGGGMYNSNESSPEILDCTFIFNTAGRFGAGMDNYNSDAILERCSFSKNQASLSGGGMRNYGSSPDLLNCTFDGNTASVSGGGMYNGNGSEPSLGLCLFDGNVATSDAGGGIYNQASSPLLAYCVFQNNAAPFDTGGGMYSSSNSTPMLAECDFVSNSADQGGGVASSGSGGAYETCTFTGNTAGSGAAMYFLGMSSPTLLECVMSGNVAENEGGAISFSGSGTVALDTCTVTENTALLGGGLFAGSEGCFSLEDSTVCENSVDQIDGCWADLGNNLVADSCGGGGDPTGACCLPGGCQGAMTEANCIGGGGTWMGQDTTCAEVSCILFVGPGGFTTIQEAINAASDNDTIRVLEGVYTIPFDEDQVFKVINKSITIEGVGPDRTFVDGQNQGRVFVIIGDEGDIEVEIKDLTIQNGKGIARDLDGDGEIADWEKSGGGGVIKNGNLKMENVDMEGCHAPEGDGGGVKVFVDQLSNDPGRYVFIDGKAFGLTSGRDGGGISVTREPGGSGEDGQVIIENMEFEDCEAGPGEGGGFGELPVEGSGGGVCIRGFGVVELRGTTFSGNQADVGGGLYVENDPGGALVGSDESVLIDCLITGNSAPVGGGVYWAVDPNTPVFTNATICGNVVGQVEGQFTDGGGNTITEECPPQCPDFNNDGIVDGGDLGSMLAAWGACPGCPEDLTGDGLVDGGDLGLLLAAFGPCP